MKNRKKKVWIFNHYATEMFFDKAGRHYWFARQLRELGHDVTVFCACTYLNGDYAVELGKRTYQKIILAVCSALIAIIVMGIMYFIFK